MSGYELAVRAVLGQQITVAAARTLAQRMVDRFGEPIDTPFTHLTRLFPEPAVLARASGDALGQLGIVKQRQAAIVTIAQAHPSLAGVETLRLLPGTSTLTTLTLAPGIRWNLGGTWVLVGSVGVPLLRGGLRAPLLPFAGLEYSLAR